MKTALGIVAAMALGLYALVGTSGNVNEIRELAPSEMDGRGWKILRYEGYEFGSFSKHGGCAWYHVANKNNPDIQYRVKISMWNGELQYYYGKPETLNRISLDYSTNDLTNSQ